MVPTENSMNLIECKEIKRNNVRRSWLTRRSLINKTNKCQANFFSPVMRRGKLEHLVTNEMIEEKHSRRKQWEKMSDRLTKGLIVG